MNAQRLALAREVIELCAGQGVTLLARFDGVYAIPRGKLQRENPLLLAKMRALRIEITHALYEMVE